MGKSTDDLIRLANDVSAVHPPRELDMLATAGERISMSLLCMALADCGVEATSFTGSQAGIITDTDHTRAKIVEVRPDRLQAALEQGQVPVVAGSRACRPSRDVTTLGRGGSDMTAVALAAALGAAVCEIYTDVTGVFSADPRIVPSARRLQKVSFDEMLEIAAYRRPRPHAAGGRVREEPSVRLHVRSSFTWEPGTWITEEEPAWNRPS